MQRPFINIINTGLSVLITITGILVPANSIRARLSALQERHQVLMIIVEIDRANKFCIRGCRFQLRNYSIPGIDILVNPNTAEIILIAIFIVDETIAEDLIHICNNLHVILQRGRMPGLSLKNNEWYSTNTLNSICSRY